MRTPQPLAVVSVPRGRDLCMDGLLTHSRPQPARHSLSSVVLASFDVVEVRHLLVEEGIADGARCIFSRQDYDALSFDEPRVKSGARGPCGEVGRKPSIHVLKLDLDGKIWFGHRTETHRNRDRPSRLRKKSHFHRS